MSLFALAIKHDLLLFFLLKLYKILQDAKDNTRSSVGWCREGEQPLVAPFTEQHAPSFVRVRDPLL